MNLFSNETFSTNSIKIINKNLVLYNNIYNNNNVNNYINVINSKIIIINIGNTCFINSDIQILIHSKNIIENFINEFNMYKINCFFISYTIFKILENMGNKDTIGIDYINILEFDYFRIKHANFVDNIQNDIQEFIRILLEDLNKDFNKVNNKAIYKELIYEEGKISKLELSEFMIKIIEKERIPLLKIFISKILNIFECE